MVRILKSKTAVDVAYQLAPGEDASVAKGVLIQSTTDEAIVADGPGSSTVDVAGRIIALDDAIQLNSAVGGNSVRVSATGQVISQTDDGISIGGPNGFVQNAGLIQGAYGIYLNYSGSAGVAQITNSGTIIGLNNAIIVTTQNAVLRNSGAIIASNTAGNTTAYSGAGLKDKIFNSGLMVGDVMLGAGDDLYDGRGGKVTGFIFGHDGNDTFRPGQFVDRIDGGNQIDTLDFRSGPAVTVNLLDASQNKGWAKGDTYLGIEKIIGSATGADKLTASSAASTQILGLGGADELTGGTQNDSLTGGAGKDTLVGGLGNDTYIYNSQSEMGDDVYFYNTLGDDVFYINVNAFGGGLPSGGGPISDSKFHSGTTNHAGDANDRFIFETDTTKLWFDRDGTGSKYAPVLVANLQDGATMSAADILIFPFLV